MRPCTDINVFSGFVLDLHERGRTQNPVELFRWSLETLARSVGADCGWGGWADLRRGDIDLRASLSYNLPDDYDVFWNQIRHEDLLARDVISSRGHTASYDRGGSRHTNGMVALADRYHIAKMAVVVADQHDQWASLFMSAYRGGAGAQAMQSDEVDFLYNALGHVRYLVLRGLAGAPVGGSILVNGSGHILTAPPSAMDMVRRHWRGWGGDVLPEELRGIVLSGRPRFIADRGIVVDAQELAHRCGQRFFTVTLRAAELSDRLTARERQIAEEIAKGCTHKEIARALSLSPTTVRNHTQAILRKLGVHNKGALARLIG
jgi:DNA-binding CsgD family transcriptional regulator